MDTLDNANANPFAINSNADIILQKEGLLLDLAKQNGDTTTNGKRSADEFDDDDDMGPETDVDAIDDVLMSPAIKNRIENNKEEEKATLETEHIKHDSHPAREEMSTPPADLVHDTSALIDSIVESGEDSDNEWNYYKGDIEDKENHLPSELYKEVLNTINNEEEMSHLNPNAAEFVPLSPKPRTDSPVIQGLIDTTIIAQSPKRGSTQNINIKLPKLDEFRCEIKSRPGEVIETNEKEKEETILNFLNGKTDEEIEIVKSPVIAKEQDPMSTSFYQDKDDADNSNPLDLNKVHVLPDNIEDYLNKPSEDSFFNDTISDLPEHNVGLLDTVEVSKSPVHLPASPAVDRILLENFISVESQSLDVSRSPVNLPASPGVDRLLLENFIAAESQPLDVPMVPHSPILPQSLTPSHSPIPPQSHDDPLLVNQIDSEFIACMRGEPIVLELPKLIDPIPISNEPDVIPVSHSPVPSHEIESPLEELTSSVKDSPLLASSPLGNQTENDHFNVFDDVKHLNQEPSIDVVSHLVQESSITHTSLLNEDILSPQSLIETESVATTDMNSFLERSLLPDVASPLSSNEQEDVIVATVSPIIEPDVTLTLQSVEIHSEVIAPQFPAQEQVVTTPIEAVVKTVPLKKTVPSSTKGTIDVAAKKPTAKATALPAKPAPKRLPATKPAPTTKTAPAKTATAPVSSPKLTSKPLKAPVVNGVPKTAAAATVTKTASTTSAKLIPTKSARPATAPAPTKKPVKPAPVPAAPKSATSTSKSSTTTTVKKTTVTSAMSTVRSTTATSTTSPRPATTTTGVLNSNRPKLAATKPLAKPGDEKSNKEAANKRTALHSSVSATKPTQKVDPTVPTRTSAIGTRKTPTRVNGTVEVKKPLNIKSA